jgi:hypothetical protein
VILRKAAYECYANWGRRPRTPLRYATLLFAGSAACIHQPRRKVQGGAPHRLSRGFLGFQSGSEGGACFQHRSATLKRRSATDRKARPFERAEANQPQKGKGPGSIRDAHDGRAGLKT